MTNTAPTARRIPNTGLTHESGNVLVTAEPTYQSGYRVQVRVDGRIVRELCSGHVFESQAVAAFNALVAQYPVEVAPRLQPAAKGTATKMSDPEVHVIGEAIESTGTIRRGRGHAAANLRTLQAMARRGFVALDHPIRPTSATVTAYGRQVHAEHVDARDEAQKTADALTHVLNFAA